MAWTTPRDWVGGELVTEAIMDTHVRDNLLAVGPHLIVRKPSDESVVSSTTLQDDNDLLMALAANTVWLIRMVALVTGTSGNFKVAFTVPAGAVLGLAGVGTDTSGVTAYHEFDTSGVAQSFAPVALPILFDGVVTCGGTAGNLQTRWAQDSSSATPTVMKANSTLWAVKLA